VKRYTHPCIYTGVGRTTVAALDVDLDGRLGEPGAAAEERLPGDVVVPGFIDTHAHLSSLGGGLEDLDLRELASPDALLAAVSARARQLPERGWVTGTGYVDGPDWGGRPTAAELDAASGGRPVALFRRDRHALLASASALALAGLDGRTVTPAGGAIARDARTGEPTGLLVDAAMDRLTAVIPAPGVEDLAREAAHKARHLASLGVTCVHEAWVSRELWAGLALLAERGTLPIRVRAMLGEGFESTTELPEARHPDWLRPIAVKGFADGALGSRGAQLRTPYADAPETRGLAVHSDEELRVRAELAARQGLQLAVHAIGDEGLRRVLALFEAQAGSEPSAWLRERRWRVEHAQLVHPDDLTRLAGVGLAVQPVHFWADAPWAAERLGDERLAWSHRLRSLVEAGARVGFGSDFPIESGDPREGLRAACALTHPEAPHWPRAAEAVGREEALQAYWGGAAWLAFDETRLGRLAPGYLADFVCLHGDPFAVEDPMELRVVATFVGGRRVERP
jgi:predicted amidohydrolase YtcJ